MSAEGQTEIEMCHEAEGFVVGRMGRLCVLRTRLALSVPAIDRFVAEVDAMAEAGISDVAAVIVPGARRPGVPEDARARANAVWPLLQERIQGMAIWVRQGSFVGSIQRSMITALFLIVPHKKPVKVLSSAAKVAEFFAELPVAGGVPTSVWPGALNRFADASDPADIGPVNRS